MRTDRQPEMTKLTAAFRDFANKPLKKVTHTIHYHAYDIIFDSRPGIGYPEAPRP
jgi:hypothetical protein